MDMGFDTFLNLETKKKVGLLVGIIVVVLALTGNFVFMPMFNEMRAGTEKVDKLRKDKFAQEIKAKNLAKYQEEVKALNLSLKKALRQLPNKKEIPSLLDSISNQARKCGLEIQLVRTQDEVEKDFYAEVPLELQLTGSYHNIAVFFSKVSALPRIIVISGFNKAYLDSAHKLGQAFGLESVTTLSKPFQLTDLRNALSKGAEAS